LKSPVLAAAPTDIRAPTSAAVSGLVCTVLRMSSIHDHKVDTKETSRIEDRNRPALETNSISRSVVHSFTAFRRFILAHCSRRALWTSKKDSYPTGYSRMSVR